MPGFDEMEIQFLSEFDYVREAQNIRLVHDAWRGLALAKSKAGNSKSKSKFDFANAVRIPEPYEQLCTQNVLTMEYMDGQPFTRGLERMLDVLARERMEAARRKSKPKLEQNADGHLGSSSAVSEPAEPAELDLDDFRQELRAQLKAEMRASAAGDVNAKSAAEAGASSSLSSLRLDLSWRGRLKYWLGYAYYVLYRGEKDFAFDAARYIELLLHFWCRSGPPRNVQRSVRYAVEKSNF